MVNNIETTLGNTITTHLLGVILFDGFSWLYERINGGIGNRVRGDLDGAEAVGYYGTLVDMVDNSIYHLDAEGRFIAIDDAVVEPPERRSRSLARAHDPSSRLHGSLLFAGKRA